VSGHTSQCRTKAANRAGITFLASTCDACELCLSGRERFCPRQHPNTPSPRDCRAETNRYRPSYPGYSEILTGRQPAAGVGVNVSTGAMDK